MGTDYIKTGNPVGRPSKYKEEYNDTVYKLALLGAIDREMADILNISLACFKIWKNDYPEFLASIKEGKEKADSNVAKSLYNRAMGYKGKDTKFATHEGAITDEREYIKHYPPETTAAIFWLKNRCPDKWSDKQQVDHTITVPNIIDDVPDGEA